MLKDKDIREPLYEWLEEHYGIIRIVEEKTIGRARADVMMIMDDRICGLEIKSDADTYARLQGQVREYNKYFDRNYVVIGTRHVRGVSEHIPAWWGIITAETEGGITDLYLLREAMPNPKDVLEKKLSLLWRPELNHLLVMNHLPAYKERSKRFVQMKLIEKVPRDLLHMQISGELFERDYTLIEQEISEYRANNRRSG